MSNVEVTACWHYVTNRTRLGLNTHQNTPEFKVEGGCANLRLPDTTAYSLPRRGATCFAIIVS